MLGDIEAVVLTGGASRRMGVDKATLRINGVSQAQRIIEELTNEGYVVTVLGREPIGTARFLRDASDFQGPLMALSGYRPEHSKVMVLSCDIPRFEAGIVALLDRYLLEQFDAAIPELNGRLQPLLGLYQARCWESLESSVEAGERKIMAWVENLKVRIVDEIELESAGINKSVLMSANSPQDLQQLLSEPHG